MNSIEPPTVHTNFHLPNDGRPRYLGVHAHARARTEAHRAKAWNYYRQARNVGHGLGFAAHSATLKFRPYLAELYAGKCAILRPASPPYRSQKLTCPRSVISCSSL